MGFPRAQINPPNAVRANEPNASGQVVELEPSSESISIGQPSPYQGINSYAFGDGLIHTVKNREGYSVSEALKTAYGEAFFATDLKKYFEQTQEGQDVVARETKRVRSILETSDPVPHVIKPWKVELKRWEDQGFGQVTATAYVARIAGSENEWVFQIRIFVDQWAKIPFHRNFKMRHDYVTQPIAFGKAPKS